MTIIVIRHAEKPIGPAPPHGVTVDGVTDPESLLPRGWQRAGALVGFFVAPDGGPGTSGLPVPTHLFASQVGPNSSSRRPLETLQPLADRLGLVVDTRFPKQAIDTLARAVLSTAGVVLVSWEHHLIPALSALLTGDPSLVPAVWPDDRFDVAWVFDRDSAGAAFRFRQVAERLLAGDGSATIAGQGSGT